jgi:hypothetical protein
LKANPEYDKELFNKKKKNMSKFWLDLRQMAAILDRDQTNGIQFRLGAMQGIFQPSSVHINIGKHFQRRVLNDCFA